MNKVAAAWTAGVMLILALGACWEFGSIAVLPQPSRGPPPRPGMQDMRLRTADGLTIAASYWRGPRDGAPAVLVLHGNGASRAAMVGVAEWLTAQGYAVLAIDFRGHGESDQVDRSFGLFEARDAHAAYRWLAGRHRGAPIGVIGISLGGAAALIGEDGPIPARCMVLQAVYPDIDRAIRNRMDAMGGRALGAIVAPLLSWQALPRFGVNPSAISPIRAIRNYKGSVLVLGGGADRFTPPEETRALFEAARFPKWYWIFGGLDHAAMSSDEGDAYRARVSNFFRTCLGATRAPSGTPTPS